MTPGHRRDFLLDSGAITAFATSQQLTGQYLDWIDRDFTGSLLIPVSVLTEIRTGDPRKDVLVDRLINRIRGEHGVYLSLSPAAASRAGVLRTEALPLISEDEDISTTDAQIVGSAEERSAFSAITILTTPSLSTSGEMLTIEELLTLRARTENAGHVGHEHVWSWA